MLPTRRFGFASRSAQPVHWPENSSQRRTGLSSWRADKVAPRRTSNSGRAWEKSGQPDALQRPFARAFTDDGSRTWATMFVGVTVKAMPFLVLGVLLSAA